MEASKQTGKQGENVHQPWRHCYACWILSPELDEKSFQCRGQFILCFFLPANFTLPFQKNSQLTTHKNINRSVELLQTHKKLFVLELSVGRVIIYPTAMCSFILSSWRVPVLHDLFTQHAWCLTVFFHTLHSIPVFWGVFINQQEPTNIKTQFEM